MTHLGRTRGHGNISYGYKLITKLLQLGKNELFQKGAEKVQIRNTLWNPSIRKPLLRWSIIHPSQNTQPYLITFRGT